MDRHTTTSDSDAAVAQRLAQRIVDFDTRAIPARARDAARIAITDTIGVTLAGSPEACVQILLDTPGVAESAGPCTIVGTNRKTTALDAALINGTASHALDYDDFSQPFGGHQSVPLVAPLLVLAEANRRSGRALLDAYVVGIETEIRLAHAVNFHHYDKGWHPTATLGIFGTVAAASHLLKLDAARTATAIAIAASFASGLKANFGTMVKPLHVGQTCRNGLFAVALAERGYTANPLAIEHKQGFFNAFNGPGTYDATRIFDAWGEPLEVTQDTLGLKQFPCCGSTHPAIAMALALKHEAHVEPEQIESILIRAHRRRLPHTDNPQPQSALGAKFSVQYVVARALVDGAVLLDHFEGDAWRDPRVQRLLSITRAEPHPDMPENSPHQFGAEVTLTLRDGTVLTRRIDNLVGRGPSNPMSANELWEKFEDCAKRAIGPSEALSLYERLEALDEVEDIGTMARLLMKRALPGAAAKPAHNASTHAGQHPQPIARPHNAESVETSWVP